MAKSSSFYHENKNVHRQFNKYFLKALLGLLIISCFNISIVQADPSHYNHVLIGNRSSGLAGAYVAIADDPSGLFYNPSGTVYSSSANVTANMNAFRYGQTRYISALTTSTGKKVDWIRTSSALVPSFFGITQPLGPGTVGFSYAITDSILENQVQNFTDIRQAGTKYTINFNNQDVTNNVGPSYAIAIGDKFSVGLTMYAYFRNKQRIFNQIYQLANDGQANNTDTHTPVEQPPFFIANQYFSLDEYGIKPILGFSYTPLEKVSLGLTLTQTFLLRSNANLQYSEATNICNNTNQTQERCANTNPTSFILGNQATQQARAFPWQANIGAAYFHSNKLLLTSSVWINEAINLTTKPLINVAGGFEYYITGKIALRMGGYTNLSNTPELVSGVINVYNEHIDIIGGTMSLTHFTRSSAISVGGVGNYGRGQAQITGSTNIQEVRYLGASIFLSASNSF